MMGDARTRAMSFRLRLHHATTGALIATHQASEPASLLSIREDASACDSLLDVLWHGVVVFTVTKRASEREAVEIVVRVVHEV